MKQFSNFRFYLEEKFLKKLKLKCVKLEYLMPCLISVKQFRRKKDAQIRIKFKEE